MPARKAVMAGQFYPSDPKTLEEAVRGYVRTACVVAAPDRVAAIIAPHAGYIYSGPTAGFAYARLAGAQPKRVVLLGRSHHHSFPGVSVYRSGGYASPLGVAPMDDAIITHIVAAMGDVGEEPHEMEHTLEVQLPFIQVVLGSVPVVPVLLGREAGEEHIRLGEVLAECLDPGDLVIASTDLSHYLSESDAHTLDEASVDMILSQNPVALATALVQKQASMCGGSAVTAAMAYAVAREANDWLMLDYRTSAQASGDTRRVVGYTAISMEYSLKGTAP